MINDALDQAQIIVFPDGLGSFLILGHKNWTVPELFRVRHYLIEFFATVKNSKTGEPLMPTTLKNYVLALQRAFSSIWKYNLRLLQGDVFACANNVLLSVLDNRSPELQAEGHHTNSHNVLSREDVRKLYSSHSMNQKTAKGYLARLFFTILIVTAMRPSALCFLKVSQFSKMEVDNNFVWKISGSVGGDDGTSKTSQGGWK